MSKSAYLGDDVYVQYRYDDVLAITTGRHLTSLDVPPSNVVYLDHYILRNLLKWLEENDPTTREFLKQASAGKPL